MGLLSELLEELQTLIKLVRHGRLNEYNKQSQNSRRDEVYMKGLMTKLSGFYK